MARGLTAAALAERLRERGVTVDPDHIYSVELGHKGIGLELRTAWAEELGLRPRDILTGAELRELIAAADADAPAGAPVAGAA
jgi:hypothetical protein